MVQKHKRGGTEPFISTNNELKQSPEPLLKPIEIKREARVPYAAVIKWLTVGHPQAGILPSIDLSDTRKRRSYRIRPQDWREFQAKLTTPPKSQRHADPMPRPQVTGRKTSGMFRY